MLVSRRTAEKLKQLIAKRDPINAQTPRGRPRDRAVVLVRCTSAIAAAESGAGAQCYPAVIVNPKSDDTEPEELGTVWLTLLGSDATAVTPKRDFVYGCWLTGDIEAAEGDVRPRAYGTPQCCTGRGSGTGTSDPDGTFAIACPLDSGSPSTSTTYSVVFDCEALDRLPNSEICLQYIDTSVLVDGVCATVPTGFTRLCGTDAVRFLATAPIDSITFCCEEIFGEDGAEVPRIACVQLLNGRRSYASIASTVYLSSTFDGYGYPINYTTPNGKVRINGRLVFCTNRSPAGWYFAGTILSTAKDPDNPEKFDCGCDSVQGGCDSSGQEITAGPVFAGSGSPSQTLKITTACGTLEIKLAGSSPCGGTSPPPPPLTYNCISRVCQPVVDGSGRFTTLSACLSSGCNSDPPVSYNCVSGRCEDPGDGSGTFTSLSECTSSGCVPAVTYNCPVDLMDVDGCTDPGDGSGTYTGGGALTNCIELCICQSDYLLGKTPVIVSSYPGGLYAAGPWARNTAGPPYVLGKVELIINRYSDNSPVARVTCGTGIGNGFTSWDSAVLGSFIQPDSVSMASPTGPYTLVFSHGTYDHTVIT